MDLKVKSLNELIGPIVEELQPLLRTDGRLAYTARAYSILGKYLPVAYPIAGPPDWDQLSGLDETFEVWLWIDNDRTPVQGTPHYVLENWRQHWDRVRCYLGPLPKCLAIAEPVAAEPVAAPSAEALVTGLEQQLVAFLDGIDGVEFHRDDLPQPFGSRLLKALNEVNGKVSQIYG